jgi:LemA protein
MIRSRTRGAVSAGLVTLAVLAFLVLGAGACVAGRYNALVGQQEAVDQHFSQMDNQYKRRFDLIPQLVSTVKGAANFEQEVLTQVTEARASVGRMQLPSAPTSDPAALEQYLGAQQNLGAAVGRLLVTMERYPELKAVAGFGDLQVQIEGTENRIAVARTDYIAAVKEYNTTLRRFPGNVVGIAFGFERLPQLEAATSSEREVPKIDFGSQ